MRLRSDLHASAGGVHLGPGGMVTVFRQHSLEQVFCKTRKLICARLLDSKIRHV